MDMETRKALGAVLSVVFILSLMVSGSCYAGEPTKLPYKIGINMELTGAFASIGEPGLEGIKARVEEINRRGGIKGHLLELVIIDDKGDTNNAVLNVKRMVEADKVHAVIAGIITMVAQAVK